MRKTAILGLLLTVFTGCSDDDGSGTNNVNPTNNSNNSNNVNNANNVNNINNVDDMGADLGAEDCIQVEVNEVFQIDFVDDVTAEYKVGLTPAIDGGFRSLHFSFDRYGNTEYVGEFELGGSGADGNFGTCAHCVYVKLDSVEKAYFANRGTLVSNRDPYSRRADFEVTNLRLIEVDVDGFTRESSPVPDGKCIEVPDFQAQGVYPTPGWTCEAEKYNDRETCDCDCGGVDPDCGGAITCLPGGPACEPRPELPVANCEASQACVFEPTSNSNVCRESCDFLGNNGCTDGVCVFDFGVGDGDQCIDDPNRVKADVMVGDPCGPGVLQAVCAVEDGFATGFCGPANVCRPLCTEDSECQDAGETCRVFSNESALGYCGPEPQDG